MAIHLMAIHMMVSQYVGDGCWTAKTKQPREWIQVEFNQTKTILAVVTQGCADFTQWVTSFILLYSQDGEQWRTYSKDHSEFEVNKYIIMQVLTPNAQRIYIFYQIK